MSFSNEKDPTLNPSALTQNIILLKTTINNNKIILYSLHMSKIQVSSDQLRSIYGQLYDVLQEKASLHLPELDDPVSREVNLQLQLFLTSVMEMAFNNLNIEGPPATDILNSRSEPFDLQLNEKVRKSYETWEEETVKVANLTRAAQETINNMWLQNQTQYLRELDSKIDADPVPDSCDDNSNSSYPIDTELYIESLESLSKTQSKLPHMRNQLQKLQTLLQHLQNGHD